MEGGAAACPEKGIIMQTSVIGFPRIGTLRELKFASEKYFRGEIGAQELLQTAAQLRKIHWSMQRNAGIDYISSNDFSHYDMVLDTAVLLGIVPKRYRELGLSELDTYFAMARGYQGKSGDVKALAMKKWFNTNYHYIVPEVEDDTVISLSGNKIWDEYEQAKSLGIETKPVVVGAYTMLKLCRYMGSRTAVDYVDDIEWRIVTCSVGVRKIRLHGYSLMSRHLCRIWMKMILSCFAEYTMKFCHVKRAAMF